MPLMKAINKWFMESTLHPKERLLINRLLGGIAQELGTNA